MSIHSTSPRASRREIIKQSALTLSALLAAPHWIRNANASVAATKKLLFFTKSAGFEHSVVKRKESELAYAERIMIEMGKKHNMDVTCSKDGRIFDKDYEQFDGFLFYTTTDLTKGKESEPAMSIKGKENLLNAIADGKGFAGSHCASDTFHSPGKAAENQDSPDPYIQMIGGEFIRHGRQQEALMKLVSPAFPGAPKDGFRLNEEWYSLKNFAKDMHVILVQETEGMVDADYKRPAYPATWARKQGKGRVFYTSMGHREDVWINPVFENLFMGGLNWILGNVEAETPPNLATVCPQASTMPQL
jgi:uncharacterized protein